jgi:hypothetical protein
MVTFRGTESASDWMSNLNVTTRTIAGVGPVHAGFLSQFQALQPELERLLQGLSNLPLQDPPADGVSTPPGQASSR